MTTSILLALYVLASIASWVLAQERSSLAAGTRLRTFDSVLAALIGLPVAMLALGAALALPWFRLGTAPEKSLPFIAAAAVGVLVLTATLTYRKRQRVAGGNARKDGAVSGVAGLASAAVTLVYAFPILFASVWMGSQSYSPVFFNVDTAYYLTHVHALARSPAYPSTSLNTLGVVLYYHYGVQLLASLLPRFGILPAHTALFWAVVPALLAGVVAVVWRLALIAARRGVPLWLAVLALFFFIEYPVGLLYDKIAPELPSDPAKAWSRFLAIVLQLERFGTGYPSPSNLASTFVVLMIGLAMVDRTMPFRLSAMAIACGTLPLFKSAFIVPVGLWLGLWSLYMLLRERDLRPLIASGAALLIALAVSSMAVHREYNFSFSLSPFSHGSEWRSDILLHGALGYGVSWLVALLLILALRSGDRVSGARPAHGLAILLSAFPILLLPVLVVVTYTDDSGKLVELTESKQWFFPLRWIPAVALVAVMADHWAFARKGQRALVTMAVGTLSVLPIVAKINDAVTLLARPSAWHDFVDNAAIAPALAAVPIDGSIVATNDLYYPAEGFARDRRQFQIGALYGHQAYGAAVRYDPSPDAQERVRVQEMLASGDWSSAVSEIACQAGWTHVLLSARMGFARGVPGTVIYDAPDFRVYALPPCL